eukprot:350510-Rhodomonas_salina.1
MLLCACYETCGTDLAYVATTLLQTFLSSAEQGYGATKSAGLRYRATVWCYAQSGSDLWYAPIQTFFSSDSHAFLLIERRQCLDKVTLDPRP